MTKAELVNKIAENSHISKADILEVVEAFMQTVKDSVKDGENVYLRGFGSFIRKHRAEKVCRNITKGTSMVVPAHEIPFFKPSDAFEV